MRKRGERTLRKLYDITERIKEAEITPVLEGNCRIQGPVDESDREHERTNSGASPADKKVKIISKSYPMIVESGTCNVCCAPCSSCMHNNRNMLAMESKIECGSNFNRCVANEADSCSFICADGTHLYKSRACDDLQRTASEASNLLSTSSSHDSYSENAESKAPVKASITCEASEAVDMPPFVPLREDNQDQSLQENKSVIGDFLFPSDSHITSDLCPRSSSKRDVELRRLECHRDDISCATGSRDSNIELGQHDMGSGNKIATYSSASADISLCSKIKSKVHVEAINCFHGGGNEERQSNYKRQMTCTKESCQKACEDSANASFSDKANTAEVHITKHNSSLKDQSPWPPSHNQYAACHNGGCKDSDYSCGSQLHVDGESSLGTQQGGLVCLVEKMPPSHHENCKAIYTGTGCSTDSVMVTDPFSKNKNGLDRCISSDQVMNSTIISKEFEKSSSLIEETSKMREPEPQLPQVMENGNSESEPELTDVKVCDICGDAGREYLLAFCSRCSDGAEHTYCMRKMLRKVPEGDWLCEECQLEEEAEKTVVDKPGKVSGTAKECKVKADAEAKKVDRPEKVSVIVKKCMRKEHAEVKKGNMSKAVKERAEAKGNVSETAVRTSKEFKQDIESKRVDASETVLKTSKQTGLNEPSQKFVSKSHLKLMPNVDMKAVDLDVRKVHKELQSPTVIANRRAENQEVTSPSRKRPYEMSGKSTEMGSPRKKLPLSREGSFKNLETGKARVANIPPTNAGQNGDNSEGGFRLQSKLGSHSLKVQAQHQPPFGFLSRSSSFNSLKLKSKVKPLENMPVKSRLRREFSLNDTREGPISRLMTKSASFKNISLGQSTVSVGKSQLRVEDPRSPRHSKEKDMVERKNSSPLDHPLSNSSPRPGANSSLPIIDIKMALHDAKLNFMSESINLRMNKGSDDVYELGRKDAKEQSISSAKIVGSISFNPKCNNEDQKPCQTPKDSGNGCSVSTDKVCNNAETAQHQGVPQISESGHQDNKTKDTSIFSISRQAVSGGNRIICCQRCNETSHATQFCPVKKLRSSALKPSAEKNSNDGNKKRNRWKDAVESTILNSRLQKNTRQSDKSDKLPIFSADVSFEDASKDLSASFSSHPGNIPLSVGAYNAQEISRISNVDSTVLTHVQDVHLQFSPPVEASPTYRDVRKIEASCTPEISNLNATASVSKELNMKHLVPKQASVLANLYRTSTIPDVEFIWQGSFELLTTGNESAPFDGIQAHLSTSASPKVLELATKFPCKVQLEEVPWMSTWPLYFQRIIPDEHNIALFFFAKDVESYERTYSKLLEKILTKDLALRGIVDGVELIIFPSTKLPLHSQRWNRLFFLWGMLKGKMADCFTSELNAQKKHFGPDLNIDPVLQDQYCEPSSVISDSQKAVSVENPQNESCRCDISAKAKELKSATCKETWATPSPKVEDRMYSTQSSPPAHNSSFQNSAYNRLPLEQSSCPIPLTHSISSTNHLSNLLISRPESMFQITNNPRCSEVKFDSTYRNKLGNEFGGGHAVVAPSAQVPGTNEQIRASRSSTSSSTSSDCRKGMGKESRTINKGIGNEEISMKNEAIFYEEDPRRKRAVSCSTEAISQAHDRECKNIFFSEESFGAKSPSNVQPLFPSFLNKQHGDCRDDDSGELVNHDDTRRGEERFFFPVKPDTPIHILSSDDEDAQESDSPNLELALWDTKNKRKDRQWKEPLDGDISASLSLSLALPSPKKERRPKPDTKPEQHLQERPGANTELLLFGGGFTDT